jgi:hypothetical protein
MSLLTHDAIDKSEVPKEAQGNALSDGTNGARQAPTAGNRTRRVVDYSTTRLPDSGNEFFFVPSKSSLGQSVTTLLQWIIF